MIQKILRSGNPDLRQKCKPVAKIDTKVLAIIRDLKDTLAVQKDPEGVGLAAPQIGKSLRIFVVSYQGFARVIINPEVIKTKSQITNHKSPKSRREILEGCLSLPNYYCSLKRVAAISVRYLNEKGKELTETFTGFRAQIVAHEIDHLNGILFIDRLLEQKKPLYKLEGDNWEEVELA